MKLILHAKATTLAVIFSATVLLVVPKVEFTFEAIMYITIFVKAALSP